MAKKSKKAKRSMVGPLRVGWIAVSRTVDMEVTSVGPISGARIDLGRLGIEKGATSVVETSGNSRYLDPAKPPVLDGSSKPRWPSPGRARPRSCSPAVAPA